jgi:hypothetical protein
VPIPTTERWDIRAELQVQVGDTKDLWVYSTPDELACITKEVEVDMRKLLMSMGHFGDSGKSARAGCSIAYNDDDHN